MVRRKRKEGAGRDGTQITGEGEMRETGEEKEKETNERLGQ